MSSSSYNLIVVSNRLPFVLDRKEDDTLYRKPSAGGLVTAVAPVVVQSKGKHISKSLRKYKNNICKDRSLALKRTVTFDPGE